MKETENEKDFKENLENHSHKFRYQATNENLNNSKLNLLSNQDLNSFLTRILVFDFDVLHYALCCLCILHINWYL